MHLSFTCWILNIIIWLRLLLRMIPHINFSSILGIQIIMWILWKINIYLHVLLMNYNFIISALRIFVIDLLINRMILLFLIVFIIIFQITIYFGEIILLWQLRFRIIVNDLLIALFFIWLLIIYIIIIYLTFMLWYIYKRIIIGYILRIL